jgi:hypothetical protein
MKLRHIYLATIIEFIHTFMYVVLPILLLTGYLQHVVLFNIKVTLEYISNL